MTVTLNKIHSNNTLITSDDDALYVYSGITDNDVVVNKWVKKKNIDYYKYYDIDINEDINPEDYNVNDYILLYSTKSNDLKNSEGMSSWNKNSIKILNTPTERYKCPQSYLEATEISTDVGALATNTSHYIEQTVKTKLGMKNIFSYLVKAPISSGNCNVAISFCNKFYNFCIGSKFNLINGTSNGIFYKDMNYNDIAEPISYIESGSCIQEIQTFEYNDQYYYRIIFSFIPKISMSMDVRLNILNRNFEFIYLSTADTEKYNLLLCGAQFEKRNDNKISDYIFTSTTPISLKTFDKMYNVKLNNDVKVFNLLENNTIQYIEESTEGKFKGETVIVSSIPDIVNGDYHINDVALIPSMIILNEGGVGTSFGNYNHGSEIGSIYYDKSNKLYKIYDDESNTWKTLASNEISKISKELINAILFNTTRYQTYSKCNSKFSNKRGFNTGGGRNFWKRY